MFSPDRIAPSLLLSSSLSQARLVSLHIVSEQTSEQRRLMMQPRIWVSGADLKKTLKLKVAAHCTAAGRDSAGRATLCHLLDESVLHRLLMETSGFLAAKCSSTFPKSTLNMPCAASFPQFTQPLQHGLLDLTICKGHTGNMWGGGVRVHLPLRWL